VVQDITKRKEAETALRDINERLEGTVRERTANLLAANRALEERALQLRLLAGELAMTEQRERKHLAKILHDGLQQYLVAAKLQVGSIVDEVPNPAIRQTASGVELLLQEAISVSRSLAAELSPPILQDAGILSIMEWLARWMASKHGINVDLVVDMDSPDLAEDVKLLLFESVRELLLNVVKHAKTNSAKVHLGQDEQKNLNVTVSDCGKGFDAERILKESIGTGGFGIFSIRERMALIGGRLEIESALGEGARFSLVVPLGAAQSSDSGSNVQPSRRPTFTQECQISTNRRTKIMLTDDHAVMREGLARLLAQEADFEVIGQANNGHQAVEMAESLHPDVILMDINMPSMNGIDATRIIHQRLPGIKIIGLSLFPEDERAKEMLSAGATFYLTKSGPSVELKQAIRSSMASGHA
jgi:CheY-like chemotaxis protein